MARAPGTGFLGLGLTATASGGGNNYFHHDAIGTVAALTSQGGATRVDLYQCAAAVAAERSSAVNRVPTRRSRRSLLRPVWSGERVELQLDALSVELCAKSLETRPRGE
jgi:hypothetical protein